MVQAHRIRSPWHDVDAGGASFVWSLAKIRVAALILFGAAMPALVGFMLPIPLVRWLCLAWLLGVALLMSGLSRRAFDDSVVLSVDQRGILDRRLMARRIEWQEIGAICPVDTDRSHTVDIRLRWPRTTLDQTSWPVRIGAHCQIGYGVPAVTFSICCLTGMSPSCSRRWLNIGPTFCTTSTGPCNRRLTGEPRRIHENSRALAATQHPAGGSRHQDESLRLGPGAAC